MIADRKLVEVRQKLTGIDAEFAAWLEDTGEKRPLRKHRSQLERLTSQLRGMADALQERVTDVAAAGDDDVLGRSRTLQTEILEVHRLWDFFRSKLNLRYVAWFRDYLAIADEFAAATFGPAQVAADAHEPPAGPLRTVPLIYFSGEFSPYTQARELGFTVEEVPGTTNTAQFLAFTRLLPIPVIAVPWYEVSFLPDAALIGHEVGHNVIDEFGLAEAIQANLAPVLAELEPREAFAWGMWSTELFSDLYGVLATGPAFVSALADLLAADPAHVAEEALRPAVTAPHPPAVLRIAAAGEALRVLGFDDEAGDALDAWKEAFPVSADPALEAQAIAAAGALARGTYDRFGDGAKLTDVLTFGRAEQAAAEATRDAVAIQMDPTSDHIRALIAGSRLAFDSAPDAFVTADGDGVTPQDRIRRRAIATIGDEPRGRSDDRDPGAGADRDAGAALLRQIQRFLEEEKR